jgi:hypothetical protein
LNGINSFSIDHIPLPALLINHHGKIDDINDVGENFSGYLKNTLLGKPIDLLTRDELNTQHINILNRSENKNPTNKEKFCVYHVKLHTPSSVELSVELRLSSVESGYLITISPLFVVQEDADFNVSQTPIYTTKEYYQTLN